MKFFVVLPLTFGLSVSLYAQAKSGPSPRPPASTAKPRPATNTPATPTPAATASTASPQTADSDNKVVLTVGEDKITAKEFDQMIEALPEQYRAQARGPMKRQMAEQIARVRVL